MIWLRSRVTSLARLQRHRQRRASGAWCPLQSRKGLRAHALTTSTRMQGATRGFPRASRTIRKPSSPHTDRGGDRVAREKPPTIRWSLTLRVTRSFCTQRGRIRIQGTKPGSSTPASIWSKVMNLSAPPRGYRVGLEHHRFCMSVGVGLARSRRSQSHHTRQVARYKAGGRSHPESHAHYSEAEFASHRPRWQDRVARAKPQTISRRRP
jgi:hypothetical protein